MLKNKSLFVKLSLSVLTCTFLILSAITLNTYFVAKNILIKDVKENARTLSDATACGIDKVFITASGVAKSLALYMENSEFNEKKLERVMRKTLDAHPEVFGCCIAFKPGDTPVKAERFAPFCWRDKGGTSFTDLGKDNYQYEYRDWYQITAITGEDVWMEPYYDEGGGNIIMSTYSYPFYKKIDGKKQFAGVITADISLHWLQKLVSGIKTIKNGYGFLISKNGTIVTHPDVSQIMNQTIFSISEEINSPELRATGRNMIAGKSGFIPHKCLLYNRPCRLSYTPLRETGWSLGIIFPEKELFMPLSKLNRDTAFFSISGIIVILIVVLYISHKITRPLHELAGAAEAVGKGDFSSPLPELKTGDEIGTLSRSFNSMQKKLAEYIENLKTTTAAKERIESELNIARDIQRSIIPVLFPAFPERSEFDIYAVLESAKAVGGDLYDFFFIDENHLFFAVGDVSGKGVPASLFMAVTQTLSRAKAGKDMPPGKIVEGINEDLCKDNEMSMFVTYFACILDIKTGSLHFCNGGHNPPYIIRSDGEMIKLKKRHGMALGVMAGMPYGSETTRLTAGDSIVLYTDGVTEAMNEANEEYSDERLRELLEKHKENRNPEKLTDIIITDVRKFSGQAEQSDDITILVMTYKG